MANGVRYLNQECVNEKFRTGYGSDYDYYVTQMAIHLARGEFTYEYFQESRRKIEEKLILKGIDREILSQAFQDSYEEEETEVKE